MKLPKLRQGERVEVRWIDASYATAQAWFSVDELENWIKEKAGYLQVGFYLKTTRDFIILCDGVATTSEGQVSQVCGVNQIPVGCVKTIRRLK